MPTEQAKPAVVTPSLQQWRSPSTFRGAPGEDPLKWLKEYDRVANFNKWDDMMCLANVYFFLDGTARQWYVNNEDTLDSWEAFKNGLSGLFGDRQKYTRRAEEQLKCRAQRSGESTQSYIQSVLGLCQEVNPLMKEDEKVSHLMKGVAEDIYQALLTREINDTASFIKWCNYIEDMKQKRVGRPRFERLPNVVPVASLTDETDLVSLIRTIVREEVHRLVNQTQESLDSDPQSLEEIVQDEVERVLAPVSTKPTETRPRPTYAAVTRKYRAPVQKFPPEPRKTDVWRTADNRPVCFHCGRPGHVMRYCRERKAVFDNSRNRRRNFDDVGTEEEIRRPNSSRRFTPSPTRGRSPIRRYRSPSPYRRSSQSPGQRYAESWDEILPFVTFAYNTAKQKTTGFTPFYLLHGREAETTLDTLLPFCPNDFDDNNITKIAARAEESRQLARVHTLRAQDKDRRRYDSKHQMVSYAPGDLVWVYTLVRKVGLSEKLLRRYFGPYQVLRRLSAVTYEVQDFDPASRKRKLREVVHVLRMKPYHDPAEQIETEDIPPKESYKGPITRSRIKNLEQNDSGALSSFSRGAMPHA
ncbi:CCHC-type domain-containing protein [Trichonephila clavipes]|nr:CCHC-type domain-containing protein [Trichonephila clavipes]